MAIISCPECNEKISDTVSQCVHCGSKIIICPECNTVYATKQKLCTNCGFEFQNSAAPKSETKKSEHEHKDAKEVYYSWERTGKAPKLKLDMWLIFAAIGLIIWAVIKLLTWNASTDFDKTSDLRDGIKTLLILAGVSYVGSNIYAWFIYTIKRRESFLGWSDSNHIDLPLLISNSLDLNFDSMVLEKALDYISSIEYCLSAVIYKKNYVLLEKEKKYRTVSTILSVGAVIFLYMFLFNNAEIYIQAELWKSDIMGKPGFKFSMMEDWWMLIAGIVLLVFESICNNIFDNLESKERDNWVKKNMPNQTSRYTKYIKKSIDYTVQRTPIDD